MSNELKFEFIKRNWQLRDGIVYSRRTGKPVSFSDKDDNGRRFQKATINDKRCTVRIHEAIYMLYHDRPIAKGKEIHHVDGDCENNAVDNLVELTRQQHKRIHQYQVNAPLRCIYLIQGLWQFEWLDDNGRHRTRRFHGINEAMTFRAEIEEPRRQELRALGLNCRKVSRGVTASQLRKISRQQNTRLWRAHI